MKKFNAFKVALLCHALKRKFLILSSLILTNLGFAQSDSIIKMLNEPFPVLSEIKEEVDNYALGLDPDELIKQEKFFKHYARWHNSLKDYTGSDGTLSEYYDYLNRASLNTNYYCDDNNANWEANGPTGQILNNNGIGRVDAITVHPNDKNNLVIASKSGGIWQKKSGTNWQNVTKQFKIPFLDVTAFARNPFNPDEILASTGSNHKRFQSSGGVGFLM